MENIIYLKFALLKTYMIPWVAVFSTSAMTQCVCNPTFNDDVANFNNILNKALVLTLALLKYMPDRANV